jgi:hypothetical protein
MLDEFSKDSDPLIAAAAKAARQLTIEEFRQSATR